MGVYRHGDQLYFLNREGWSFYLFQFEREYIMLMPRWLLSQQRESGLQFDGSMVQKGHIHALSQTHPHKNPSKHAQNKQIYNTKYKTHTQNTRKLLTKFFIEQLLQLHSCLYIMAWTSLRRPLFSKFRRVILLKLKYFHPILLNMQR